MSLTPILLGLLVGLILAAGVMVVLMRIAMIEVYKSSFSLEATVERLEQAIRAAGWMVPDSKRLNESFAKGKVAFPRQVHLIKLCEPHHAAEVLTDNRQMACMMPCTFAVYESDEGDVLVSKVNTRLMGKVFGGSIGRVMGGAVATEEKAMLRAALGV
jgi:uncharacterized protein (DUF302 family)